MEFKLSKLKGIDVENNRMLKVEQIDAVLQLRAGYETDDATTFTLLRRDEALMLSAALRDMAEGLERQ